MEPEVPGAFSQSSKLVGGDWSSLVIFGYIRSFDMSGHKSSIDSVCFPTFTSYVPQYLFGHFISQEFGLPMAGWLEATMGTLPREVPLLPTTSSEIMMFETFGKLPRLWDFLILGFPV